MEICNPCSSSAVPSTAECSGSGSGTAEAFEIQQLQCGLDLAITHTVGFAADSFRAASTTKFGGATPCFSAHLSFSTSVWQQQARQQLSASLHPQGESWQGKGLERSFAGRSTTGTPIVPTANAHKRKPTIGFLNRRPARHRKRLDATT